MSLGRVFGVFFGIVGAALLAVVLYIAFGDLSRHKGRIEALVTQSVGRPFAIDGPLKLRVIPVIDVSVERVRLGNVQGGSQEQMLQIGKAAVQIGLWSLISGSPDVRLFELSDATLLMERGSDGKGNWIMGAQEVDDDTEADTDAGATEVPLIIRNAQLNNVRLIYREVAKPDRVLQLDKLGIATGQEGLLALDGRGSLDAYPLALKGETGPLQSLVSLRDIRAVMQVSLGKLAIDVNGVVGRLDPLDGADLTLRIEQPDVGAMLAALDLPVVVTGPMRIDTRLKDTGAFTQLDLKAEAGDFKASANGKLRTLSLVGSDLTLKVEQPDVRALLEALDLPIIATGPMRIDSRLKDAGALMQLDLKAEADDFKVSANGTLETLSLVGSDLTIEVALPEVGALLEVLDLPAVASGPIRLDTRLKDAGALTQLDLKADGRDFKASATGTFKALSLDGAELTLKVEQSEIGALLKALDLPVVATGPVRLDTRLKDAGALKQVDFKAEGRDFKASAKGTFKTLSLVGADLTLRVEQSEVGALLEALDLPVIATGPMRIDTRLKNAGTRTQLDLKARLGDLKASAQGTLREMKLFGSDLILKVEASEVSPMLKALDLSGFAAGPMQIDTTLKRAGALTQLDFKAKIGDLRASAYGTLRSPNLVGSDLTFEATAADASRLAGAFGVSGVPAEPIRVTGHAVQSREEIKFDSLMAVIAGASVRAHGSVQVTGTRKIAVNFEAAAASLAKLRTTWPEIAVSASGAVQAERDRIAVRDLRAALGRTEVAGALLLNKGAKRIEAQLSSPRVDLTPFFPQDEPVDSAASTAPPPPAAPKKKFMFSDTPLPFEEMRDAYVNVHLTCGELLLGNRALRDLYGNLQFDRGKLTLDMRATGAREGELQGAGIMVIAGNGMADLGMKIDIRNMRPDLGGEGIAPADVPPLSVAMDIRIHGSSPRQMAAGANGHLLLTQGAGRTRSGFIAAYGGGVAGQLAQKLNPFAKDDPFMKLDCTIARADIVNGQVTVKPVLLQSEKVTIAADGTIDLHTEALSLDFNTRPRKGIGVSPGMFTNPFIRLEGTLASPHIGVGAKGVASGAIAAATGGVSVVAGGLVDRVAGEADLCGKTLTAATQPDVPGNDSTK